jgi:hypothetical protein
MPATGYRKYPWNRSSTGIHWSSEGYWAKVDKQGQDDCWLWLGSVGPQGGLTGIRKDTDSGVKTQMTQSRRLAWAEHTGEFPAAKSGLYHLCKNKLCQNPSHFITHKPCLADFVKFNERKKQ